MLQYGTYTSSAQRVRDMFNLTKAVDAPDAKSLDELIVPENHEMTPLLLLLW